MPRALNGDGERALALRGETGLAARLDLAALRNEPAQARDVLVVDLIDTIGREDVYPAAPTTAATKAATATPEAPATTATKTTAAPAAAIATIIGAGGTVVHGCAIARRGLRTLLINHELFLLR
jgi:hypothetical protein